MDQLLLISLVAFGLPLVAFVLVIFNQRALNERAHLIALPAIAFSLVLSLYVAWVKLKGGPAGSLEWSVDWIRFGTVPGFGPLTIPIGILLDNITAILMVVVTGVSFLVHLFSSEYMKQDARYARYFAYLGLFTSAMLGLVLANNLFVLFICWELVGFTSYLLIGHWYERSAPQYASKKAFIVNRVGDAFMWIGILLLFAQFHTFNYREIFGFINQGLPITFSFLGFSPEASLTVAGVLLFAGAIAKSAQFPLHTWLPDAMEGPTPVSALIHAATMVAAGVYLMARIFPLLTGDAMLVVSCVGAVTAVIAATSAVTQTDIKRVLAYSTISQLGLMMMSIGSGAVAAGLFHLVIHAAFKACLFLGAGSVIQAMHKSLHEASDHETDAQDIRNMGGFLKKLPFTGWSFIVAALALTGLPLTAGFLSKDEVLSGVASFGRLQSNHYPFAQILPIVGLIVTLLTAFYIGRLVFMVFFGVPSKRNLFERLRESPVVMTVPIMLLALFSIWIWYSPNPVDPESGWFLRKWIATPVQVIPPQTAPMFTVNGGQIGAIADIGSGSAQNFGFNVTSISVALPTTPMPHQRELDLMRRSVGPAIMVTSAGLAILGLFASWLLFLFRPGWSRAIGRVFAPVRQASLRGWHVDELYDYVIVGTILLSSRIALWVDVRLIDAVVNGMGRITVILARVVGWFDRFVVDGIVTLVGATVQFLGLMTRSLQSGRIQSYLSWVVASVVVLFLVIRYVFLASP